MNLTEVGKFITELRKEHGLTQEQLGEKIGITNKTISRWETGTYLPPADALLALSERYGVSINEILAGKRISEQEYKQVAEENLLQVMKSSSFSLKDRIAFYKKKWLKDHVTVICIYALCIIAELIGGIILSSTMLLFVALGTLIGGHIWRYNTMMAYVEQNAFDGKGSEV